VYSRHIVRLRMFWHNMSVSTCWRRHCGPARRAGRWTGLARRGRAWGRALCGV